MRRRRDGLEDERFRVRRDVCRRKRRCVPWFAFYAKRRQQVAGRGLAAVAVGQHVFAHQGDAATWSRWSEPPHNGQAPRKVGTPLSRCGRFFMAADTWSNIWWASIGHSSRVGQTKKPACPVWLTYQQGVACLAALPRYAGRGEPPERQ